MQREMTDGRYDDKAGEIMVTESGEQGVDRCMKSINVESSRDCESAQVGARGESSNWHGLKAPEHGVELYGSRLD